MGDKLTTPREGEERVRSTLSALDTTHKGSDVRELHVVTNDLEKEATLPSRSQNMGQPDIVDWEGQDDPAKPMNW
jgi:hypothetical protein